MDGLCAVFILCLYNLFDFLMTIFLFGFYTNGHFEFNIDVLLNQLLLIDGYNFTKNPFDFLILSMGRWIFTVIGIVLKFRNVELFSSKSISITILGISIINWACALIKLLAFAENENFWKIPGIWFSLSFSIVSTVILIILWQFIICSRSSFNYRSLINDARETGDSENSRKGAFEHAVRLLQYCLNYWQWYLAGFIFLVLYSGTRIFIPYFTGQVVATIVQTREITSLLRSIVSISILTTLSTLFGGIRGGCFDYSASLVHRKMRLDLFRSVISQEIAFFDVIKTGEVVSRLTADCQVMSSTVATNVNVFLRNGIMIIGGLIFMFALSWRLSMVTFITIPLVLFITNLFGSFYDKLSTKIQETIADANHVANEVISTIRTVRSFACEWKEVDRFKERLQNTFAINRTRSIVYVGYTWANEFCDNVILVAVLCYGGHLVISGQMSISNLISFLFYQLQLGENFYSIGYAFTGLMESVGASRKVFEYMCRAPKVLNNGTRKTPVKGKIEFDQVTFWYPSRPNNIVLKEISFCIYPGETVALVGPSGGGKSSIISLIEHFYDTAEGGIYLDDFLIAEYDHHYIHEKIALVAQEPVLFDGSIRYNILYGCDWATEEDMLNASQMANVHNFVMETEYGYDTNCGEKGVQMSGGQKQRIAIARALVRKPAVLILDEATSALDAENEHLVQEAISRCTRERTVIIIAHRLSTVEKADRIIVINQGQVVQQGRHEELIAEDGLYKLLTQRQLLGLESNMSIDNL